MRVLIWACMVQDFSDDSCGIYVAAQAVHIGEHIVGAKLRDIEVAYDHESVPTLREWFGFILFLRTNTTAFPCWFRTPMQHARVAFPTKQKATDYINWFVEQARPHKGNAFPFSGPFDQLSERTIALGIDFRSSEISKNFPAEGTGDMAGFAPTWLSSEIINVFEYSYAKQVGDVASTFDDVKALFQDTNFNRLYPRTSGKPFCLWMDTMFYDIYEHSENSQRSFSLVKPFLFDKVLIKRNLMNSHWYGLVVDLKTFTVRKYDSMNEYSQPSTNEMLILNRWFKVCVPTPQF